MVFSSPLCFSMYGAVRDCVDESRVGLSLLEFICNCLFPPWIKQTFPHTKAFSFITIAFIDTYPEHPKIIQGIINR